MTNKYQEALQRLATESIAQNGYPASELRVLQELVDKSEYKAPEQVAHVYGTIIECPVCHQPITNLGKYCCECGQRIKPNEENG